MDHGRDKRHMMQGSRRDSTESGAQAQAVRVLGAEGGAQPTQAHTYCQCSFSLFPAGAGGPWPPLRTTDGTGL